MEEYRGLKIGEEAYILKNYEVEEVTIKGFEKRPEHDGSDYELTFVIHSKGVTKYDNVYETEDIAELYIKSRKKSYDNYVTKG